MRIGIAYDLAPAGPALDGDGPDDRFEEFDRPETVDAIARVIRSEGHDVTLLGDGPGFLRRILAFPPDFVFNIAEGEGVGRTREARVPAVLEMLGIPYSGSDPLTLAASLDKGAAKLFVGPISRPQSTTLNPRADGQACQEIADFCMRPFGREVDEPLPFPLILKPAFEGSSKGIRGQCLARTGLEAIVIYKRLAKSYHQPVVVEEFISGDEVTVGIVGNVGASGAQGTGPWVLGVMRIIPRQPDDHFVYSLEVKRDWRARVTYEAPARLSPLGLERVKHAARSVYQTLGCRDLARIDFRMRDDQPYFIEANPLPGLAPETSDLVILARGHGIDYPDLIRAILHESLTRVGLK